jgi:predicted transcriptional regulator
MSGIELDEAEAAHLQALANRTGLSTKAVVREALEHYSSALDQAEEAPPYSAEEIAAIEEGLAAIERGDVISHEQVFAKLRDKYGA